MVSPGATDATSIHQIIFDNFKGNECLSYSLAIVKGHIAYLKNSTQPSSYLLTVLIETDGNKKCLLIPIDQKTGMFKFLIDLSLGNNSITVTCCCASVKIALEYKPRCTNLLVCPLYIICDGHDGKFQAPDTEPNTVQSASKRIIIGCKLIQSLFAEKLYDAGFERRTFELNSSNCLVFHSKLHFEEVYKMDQIDLWYYFAREIMSSKIGNDNNKYLAFLSCTKYDGSKYIEGLTEQNEFVRMTKGYVAFGGNGLALLGTACLYTWPEDIDQIAFRFKNVSVVDHSQFLDDSFSRGTLGGSFSTNLGSVLHELCHTFDLGHTKNGIMGRGFDNIQNVFLLHQNNSNNTKVSQVLNLRLTDINQYNFNKNDDIYFNNSCLVILNYHRWFNSFPANKDGNLWYDVNTKIVKSTSGIRVIEIRRKSGEMLLKEWIFLDKVLKHYFQIILNETCDRELIVFVEDSKGNILKESF